LETVGTPLLWTTFSILIVAVLAIDLGVFHRKAHAVRFREAISWVVVWVTLAMAFALGVYWKFGSDKALEFLTGYIIEEALSVDNVFVFIVIFAFFRVPKEYQHRILFWGILGALIMRAIFIFAGAALLQRFHWILYVFGGILIVTGVRMLLGKDEEIHPERNLVYRAFRRVVPMAHAYHGQNFFVVENGRRLATPLLLVLVVVEATDVIFAVDSIPAIFAITTDPFIVYTSNIFAILGLRNLYFVVARFMEKFHFLKIGLAFVLLFVGVKMLIADYYKIPITVSLAVVAGVLALSVVISILRPPRVEELVAQLQGTSEPPPEVKEWVEGDEPERR
jgi:TerC family integral membrane protein